MFCLVSFLMYWSPFGNIHHRYKLVVRSEGDPEELGHIIEKYCMNFTEKSKRSTGEGVIRKEYLVEIDSLELKNDLFNSLLGVEEIKDFRIDALNTSEDQL